MPARFRLQVLGECQLIDQETGQATEFRTRKAKCVLGLVALWPNAQMSREKLASFLWDPAPEEQARASLRQCLKEIRHVLGPIADAVLIADRSTVRLAMDTIEVDAMLLQGQLQPARHDVQLALKIASLWRGELFGDTLPSAPLFEAWVQVERSRLRDVVSNLLTEHLQQQLNGHDFTQQNIALELLRLEPCHELAHQFLMQFHAKRGDQAAALRQYAALEQALADELDSEPSIESNELLVAVKRGDIRLTGEVIVPVRAPQVDRDRTGPPKIAIRAPLTRYKDESKDYLAEGFLNLAKVSLSKFRCWIIIHWPSSGFDSKVKVDFPALGEAIGADYILDPVLDWRGGQGKLFVSVIDCRDGSEIWSDIFPIDEGELQGLSSMVAGAVASRLASRFNHITLLRFARSKPSDALAYDMWLRGHQLSRAWSLANDEQAQELFHKAIALDPGLACSYASLAAVLSTQGMLRPGYADAGRDKVRAFELAQKAISLDPFDSRNHITMAWNWLLAPSAQRAQSHFKLAVELNPYDSETLIASANGMAFMGHTAEALKWAKDAVDLNPLYPDYFLGYLAAIHYLSGDMARAVEAIALCPEVFPNERAWAAAAHARLGENDLAAQAYRAFAASVSRIWEGAAPPSQQELHAWLFNILPITWKEGRKAMEADLQKAAHWAEQRSARLV